MSTPTWKLGARGFSFLSTESTRASPRGYPDNIAAGNAPRQATEARATATAVKPEDIWLSSSPALPAPGYPAARSACYGALAQQRRVEKQQPQCLGYQEGKLGIANAKEQMYCFSPAGEMLHNTRAPALKGIEGSLWPEVSTKT